MNASSAPETLDTPVAQPAPTDSADAIELSVVMPCLNEADTLEVCIRKALKGIAEAKVRGEVVVADNGSTDGSQEIARRAGARVVPVKDKGYGNALMGGIAAAAGKWVIMGDADDSYDFLEIPRFVEKLREGHDLVQGCRLPGGGGTIAPGAMPFLHRVWGNPMFTFLVRKWFHAPINDVYCGLRGFKKSHYERLEQRCTGMEFATEMIIKSSLYQETFGVSIAEVPITLHPDGRKAHAPHLRTFRDGWRTLRFFMLYCPRWLFVVPGFLLLGLGFVLGGMVYGGVAVGEAVLDAHSLLVAALLILLGYQSLLFAGFTKVFAVGERLMPPDPTLSRWVRWASLERGVALGAASFLGGVGLIAFTAWQWMQGDFGRLDYAATMRIVIPGVTMASLGFQTVFASFFLSILGMRRK
jgi:glycosyltransferase involved in cell wall biosynthesis